MKEFIKEVYKNIYKEDLVKTEIVYIEKKPPVIEKTNREKLLDFALTFVGIDPTPKDVVDDDVACSEVLTTILKKYLIDFDVIISTSSLLYELKLDKRFKETTEFKEGNIILSPTFSGNGKVIGHVGLIGKNGKILSNSSPTGLFSDKYNIISWIQRYSKAGQLDIYIFELL